MLRIMMPSGDYCKDVPVHERCFHLSPAPWRRHLAETLAEGPGTMRFVTVKEDSVYTSMPPERCFVSLNHNLWSVISNDFSHRLKPFPSEGASAVSSRRSQFDLQCHRYTPPTSFSDNISSASGLTQNCFTTRLTQVICSSHSTSFRDQSLCFCCAV